MVIFQRSPWNIFCFLLWSQKKWLSAKKRAISSRSPITGLVSAPQAARLLRTLQKAHLLKIIATSELAGGGKQEENREKYIHIYLYIYKMQVAYGEKFSQQVASTRFAFPDRIFQWRAVTLTHNTAEKWVGTGFPCWAHFSLMAGTLTLLWQQLWCAWFRN